MKYSGLIFDLNGTMVDDMDYHIKAWHEILNGLGADVSLERTKKECYGKNGELLERVFPGRFDENEKNSIGLEKEKAYQKAFLPRLKLIKGLDAFITKARTQGLKIAIGSAAIRDNIDFVIDGLDIRDKIDVIVSADDVENSKPDPETFLDCAQLLSLSPDQCLVFEDAPKGVEAALNSKMDCVVITSMHERNEFNNYSNVIEFISDYNDFHL